MLSLVLECAYEAILDAGYHPSDFEGTRTGVFIGSCLSEMECFKYFYNPQPNRNTILM